MPHVALPLSLAAAFAALGAPLSGAPVSATEPPAAKAETGSPVAAAPATPAWTNARIRSLSPEQVTRQLLGELSSALLPDFALRELNVGTYGRLYELSFYSVPRAGLDSGFCESDWVRISFAPIDRGADPNADVPVRPSKIESSQIYFIWNLERAVRGGIRTVGEQARFDETCAAHDPRKEKRIAAQDPDDIVIALRLLTELTRSARRGRALAPLDCTGLATEQRPRIKDSECLAEIAAIKPGEIDWAPPPETTASGVTRRTYGTAHWLQFLFAPGQTLPTSEFSYGNGRAVPIRIVVGRPPDLPPLIIYD